MLIETRALARETERDFFRMREHPSCDWCFCMAWRAPSWDGWGERTAAQNRAAREELFARGAHDGVLLYADGAPVGWCQCAPLASLPRFAAQMGVAVEDGDWAVACLEVLPDFRKKGLSRVLLDAALARARGRRAPDARVPPPRPPRGRARVDGARAALPLARLPRAQGRGRAARAPPRALRPGAGASQARREAR